MHSFKNLYFRYRRTPTLKREENTYSSLNHSPMSNTLAAPRSAINLVPNDHIYALPDPRSNRVYNSNEPSSTISLPNRGVPRHGDAIKSSTDLPNMDTINYTIPSVNERCLLDNNINQALDIYDSSSCVQEAENPIYDSMSMDSQLYMNTSFCKDSTHVAMYKEPQLVSGERYTSETMATEVPPEGNAKSGESNVLSHKEQLNINVIAKHGAIDAEYSEVLVEKYNVDPKNAQIITDTGYFILEQPSSPNEFPAVQTERHKIEPESTEAITDAGYFVIEKCDSPHGLHVS